MKTVFLVNYDTPENFDACIDDGVRMIFDSLVDFSSPKGLVIEDEELLSDYREDVRNELEEWHNEMDDPLPECQWHFTGWSEAIAPDQGHIRRIGTYELLPVESLYDKTFKTPEPIAVIVVHEMYVWSKSITAPGSRHNGN
jgi:hypothetical protein